VVALSLSATLIVTAGPALAAAEEGSDPGSHLGIGLAILIFVGSPVALFIALAAGVYGPSALRRPRYRPGQREWGYRSLWIGGPESPDTALTATVPDAVIDVRGGGAGASW
jgi:hypothetical protein